VSDFASVLSAVKTQVRWARPFESRKREGFYYGILIGGRKRLTQ
jgi:hypothetical protein